ncbi:MAG: hypothetical protein Q7S87_02965 [Agitococcus sp.]|nr:hypothetical protein [Agitococcus sp.]
MMMVSHKTAQENLKKIDLKKLSQLMSEQSTQKPKSNPEKIKQIK